MTYPIFLDANIPVYAAGLAHPLKGPCIQVLRQVADKPTRFFTDSEVFQELLHRYLALHRWREGKEVFHEFGRLMQGRVEPVTWEDVDSAGAFADQQQGVSARDLLHRAIMARLGCDRAISTDRDFDRFPEIERLDPMQMEAWRAQL